MGAPLCVGAPQRGMQRVVGVGLASVSSVWFVVCRPRRLLMVVCCGGAWGVVLGLAVPGRVWDMRGRVGWGWGGRACVGLRVCLLLSPRSLPLPFPCSSLFAGLFGFVFFLFFGGGWLGCCAWVWVCAGAGAGVGVGVVGDGGRVAVVLWVPCVCAGPQASGPQGAGPGGADGGWLAAVVAWRLRGWSRLLGSA